MEHTNPLVRRAALDSGPGVLLTGFGVAMQHLDPAWSWMLGGAMVFLGGLAMLRAWWPVLAVSRDVPDVRLSAALDHLAEERANTMGDSDVPPMIRLAYEVQRKAGAGRLRVWGRPHGASRYEEIESAYWDAGGIDMLSVLQESIWAPWTEPKQLVADFTRYEALRVNGREFLAEMKSSTV